MLALGVSELKSADTPPVESCLLCSGCIDYPYRYAYTRYRHSIHPAMALVGYWRTSTTEQDAERQIQSLLEAGCEKDLIYGDQITGTSAYGDRPGLSECLKSLRPGDTWVIHELDRAGRSMVEMLVQINGLIERGIHIKTLDKRLDTASMPEELVKLVVGVMGYAAEMELKSLKKRTAEGRAVAKSRGVKFGRKKTYTEHQEAEVLKKRSEGEGYGTIARSLGMSRSMVQRIVKDQEAVA